MNKSIYMLMAALLLSPLAVSISGCGCGFDCNNGNNRDEPAVLTLGLSDSLPEELKQVVIEVDSITFRRSGADDVVVENFTINELGLSAADSFQIDLLHYRGVNQLLVIEDLELEQGIYSEILITILDDNVNLSYVQQEDDSLKAITLSQAELSLPGMDLSFGDQSYTVEFGLAQSLQYQPSADNYLLTAEGVRVEDIATAASLSGQVQSSLFDTVTPCSEKEVPAAGNRVYLYQGIGLSQSRLADVFTSGSSATVPAEALAPFAVAALLEDSLTGGWRYSLGYLPAGDYTIAFACDTADDHAVEFDDLVVPLPTDQVYEITLAESETAVCNLDDVATSC